MKIRVLSWLVILSFILSGCVTRSYKVVRDRVDQNLESGNRGYLMGKSTASFDTKERKLTRVTRVVEIEILTPAEIKEKLKKKKSKEQVLKEQSDSRQIDIQEEKIIEESVEPESAPSGRDFKSYTVEKNDTLQKISQKLYGTTKKWNKIFEANKDALGAANKIYPGQVLKVPVYEEKENLK